MNFAPWSASVPKGVAPSSQDRRSEQGDTIGPFAALFCFKFAQRPKARRSRVRRLLLLRDHISYENTSPAIRESVRVESVFWTVCGTTTAPVSRLRTIFSFKARSIERNSPISAPETRVEARPVEPMRPVRPTR